MDKNGKIFGKISIIDLAAILLVIVAIIGITMRFQSMAAENARRKVSFSYTVEIDGVRMYAVDALNHKGLVTDEYGNIVGEIETVEYEEKKEQVLRNDGESVMATVPDRYKVKVILTADGKESDSGYFVGENTELSVGSTLTMYTKYANCTGKIIEITKIENQG